MSALVLARDFPGSASEFERRNVYMPCLVIPASKGQFMSVRIIGFQSSLAPSSLLSSKRSYLH